MRFFLGGVGEVALRSKFLVSDVYIHFFKPINSTNLASKYVLLLPLVHLGHFGSFSQHEMGTSNMSSIG